METSRPIYTEKPLDVKAPETWPPDVRKAIDILAAAFSRVFGGDGGKTEAPERDK